MNYWNTELIQSGNASLSYDKKDDPNYKQAPNNKYVVKTIYDPSPAGFKIPPIKAFADLFDNVELEKTETTTKGKQNTTVVSQPFVGWTVNIGETTFYFPATGVRDMGIEDKKIDYGTFPGFSSITYIATSGFHKNDAAATNSSCLIFAIDKRGTGNFQNCTIPIEGTNNAYGFTVRPIRDGQKGN